PVEQFVLVATMWAVMMVGMMLPGAAPMILLYTAVQRKQGRRPVLMSGVFGAGYLLVWGGFAIAAAAVQVLLTHMALLSSSLTSAERFCSLPPMNFRRSRTDASRTAAAPSPSLHSTGGRAWWVRCGWARCTGPSVSAAAG